jgi:hypothetical protein
MWTGSFLLQRNKINISASYKLWGLIMSFVGIILLSVVMSADAMIFGISFGLKKIRISMLSLLIITLSALIMLFIASEIGMYIGNSLVYSQLIGSFVLIGVGMWLCADTDVAVKNMLDNPEKADINKSKNIEISEAVIMGIVLSLDSATIVFGTSMTDSLGKLLPICVLIFQILFILAGIKIGEMGIKNIPAKTINILSGFVIVLIGLYKLSLVFC